MMVVVVEERKEEEELLPGYGVIPRPSPVPPHPIPLTRIASSIGGRARGEGRRGATPTPTPPRHTALPPSLSLSHPHALLVIPIHHPQRLPVGGGGRGVGLRRGGRSADRLATIHNSDPLTHTHTPQ